MNKQNKKQLMIVAILILVIVLIAVLAIKIGIIEKKPIGNNGLSTDFNSENEVVDVELGTDSNTECVLESEMQEIIETESVLNSEVEAGPPATTETKEPEENNLKWTVTDMDKTMYAKSSVNVRKGPGTEYNKLGSLTTDQEVKVTGKCNEFDWYRIIYNGNEAYVSCNYLLNNKITTNTDTNINTENNTQNKEENNTPSTPEPAYGTISFENENQKEEWQWNYVDVADIWTEYGWAREVRDSAYIDIEWDELFKFSYMAYPEREDEGEYIGQRIEYPTFWVYVGQGHF